MGHESRVRVYNHIIRQERIANFKRYTMIGFAVLNIAIFITCIVEGMK